MQRMCFHWHRLRKGIQDEGMPATVNRFISLLNLMEEAYEKVVYLVLQFHRNEKVVKYEIFKPLGRKHGWIMTKLWRRAFYVVPGREDIIKTFQFPKMSKSEINENRHCIILSIKDISIWKALSLLNSVCLLNWTISIIKATVNISERVKHRFSS